MLGPVPCQTVILSGAGIRSVLGQWRSGPSLLGNRLLPKPTQDIVTPPDIVTPGHVPERANAPPEPHGSDGAFEVHRLLQVEAIVVHDLGPRCDEIVDELLAGVV